MEEYVNCRIDLSIEEHGKEPEIIKIPYDVWVLKVGYYDLRLKDYPNDFQKKTIPGKIFFHCIKN